MRTSIVAVITLCTAGTAAAQQPAAAPKVLRVPAQYATVQAAIDSAGPGDTVLVAPGRYYENLRFGPRNFVLTSHYALGGDRSHIAATILDGSRPADPDTASVIIMDGDQDSTTVIQGFTITGGRGTLWLDPRHKLLYREGGGILCEFASPVIQYNIIEGNEAVEGGEGVASAGGGGIRCGFNEPTIRNNVIRGNRGRYGGGIVLFYAAARVQNNLITGNSGGEEHGGAGLWAIGHLSRTTAHLIERNTIVDNVALPSDSATPRDLRGKGGGMVVIAPAVLRGNVVWANRQQAGPQVVLRPRLVPMLEHNVVQGGFRFADGTAPKSTGTLETDPAAADPARYGADRAHLP
jgi:hypothetical protein